MTLTEGPLGFPMPDKAARALDALLKTLPKTKDYEYRKALVARPPTELNPGERSDVSWITTESVDRMGEVVVARGMNDGQFQLNPLVTLGHAYWLPPVGKSCGASASRTATWSASRPRRSTRRGRRRGRPATTGRPTRCWRWSRPGCSRARASAFCRRRVHVPDTKEAGERGWGDRVGLVIDEWLLLEYACVFLPANQDALVEAVSKGAVALDAELLRALGVDAGLFAPRLAATRGARSADYAVHAAGGGGAGGDAGGGGGGLGGVRGAAGGGADRPAARAGVRRSRFD